MPVAEVGVGVWRILFGTSGSSMPGFVGTLEEAIARFDKAEASNPRVILTLVAGYPGGGEELVGGHNVDGERWGVVA